MSSRNDHLRPPLELLWALESGFAVRVSDTDLAYVQLNLQKQGLAAVAPDGRVLWSRPAKGLGVYNPQPLPGGTRLTAEGAPRHETLSVLEAHTGTVLWTGKHQQILPVLPDDNDCVAIEWAIPRGQARVLRESLPPEPTIRWDRAFRVKGRSRRHLPVRTGPLTANRFFLLDRSDPARVAVLAVDPRTGQDQWRADARSLPALPRGDGDWRASLADGDRLVYRTENGVACLDARTGEGLWSTRQVPESTVFRDVIVASQDRTVWLASSETGKHLRKRNLTKVLTAMHSGNRLTIGSAVSETHVFVCDVLGALWALERESLEPVWSHCPAGTVGGLNTPRIIRGRLYANTVSWRRGVPNHLYCWGPARG